jgi:integrase
LRQWLDDVKPTVKPKTFRSYEQLTRVHLIPSLGKIRLAKLTAADVKRTLAQRQAAGSSPRTRAYILAVLSMALSRAVEGELIGRNVASLVKPPRQVQREINPLSPDAVRALLAVAQGHRFEHLFQFLLGTGLRLGEALALSWNDFDPGYASVTVRHTLERIPGQPPRLASPKLASGRRVVPLIGPAAASLKAQRQRVADMSLPVVGSGLVFPNAVGNPCDGTNVLHELKNCWPEPGCRRPSACTTCDMAAPRTCWPAASTHGLS